MILGSGLSWWPGMKFNPQLEYIQDVRKVFNQIVELQKNRKTEV